MRVLLFTFFIEAVISLFTGPAVDRELLICFFLVINVFILMFEIKEKSEGNKILFSILIGGLYLRLIALLYDQGISFLPFNTADAHKFHELAVNTANALPDEMLEFFNGFYTQFLGVVYYIFGPYRYLGQFINICFVMLAATKLVDIANLMKLSMKNKCLMIGIWCFAPIPFLMGFALVREASMYYFIVLSIYHFLKWFERYSIVDVCISILAVYLASLYHEWVIVIAVPYLYTYLFYDRKKHRIKINLINVASIVLAFIIGFTYISQNSEKLMDRTNVETGGGSSYLTNLKVETPIEFILFGPIKAVYLIYSPMPWLIRDGLDIVTFVFDSCLWVYVSWMFIKNFREMETKYKMLILCILIGGYVFGMGTLNTGTAIRHRNKFMSLMLVAFMSVKNQIDLKKEGKCEEKHLLLER